MLLRKLPLILAVTLLLAAVSAGVVRAQGSPVRDFTVQQTGGGSAALSSFADHKAVVVVFVNPGCAFSRLYQERLTALRSAFESQGVAFMFINVPINLEGDGGGANLANFTDGGAASAALGVSKPPRPWCCNLVAAALPCATAAPSTTTPRWPATCVSLTCARCSITC